MIMALNFPASPSDGDEFNGYVWIESQGAWRKNSGKYYTVSDTEPLSPRAGQTWFNTNLGAFFVYYGDGDSYQWVEVGGGAGVTGPQGIQGEQGVQGEQGIQGEPGVDGADGIQMGKAIAAAIVFG